MSKDNQCEIRQVKHGETVKKSGTNEMWVCRVVEGEAVVSFEMREQTVRKGDAFVVMEGEMFLVVSSSEEMAMEVMVFRSAFLNVVYPFLGPEVNWSLIGGPLRLFGQMEPPYGQMLLLEHAAHHRHELPAVGRPLRLPRPVGIRPIL